MADRISKEHRSWNMSQIHGKDTRIEQAVRSYLFREGFRFRKNDPKLPGKPDVVLPKYRTVIFVNGCFWHRHEGCKLAYMPKTQVEFWQEKFTKTQVHDKLTKEKLRQMGWNVVILWECELKHEFEPVMIRLVQILKKELTRSETSKNRATNLRN